MIHLDFPEIKYYNTSYFPVWFKVINLYNIYDCEYPEYSNIDNILLI